MIKRNGLRRLWRGSLPIWTLPLAIFLLGLLAFGLLLPQWGFYWDDWAKISVSVLFGSAGYPAYYAEDRPLSAWTHMLFTPLLGVSPLPWHIFQFFLTLLSAWGVYWSLTRLWPRARWQSAAAALLFVVYPVFTQHPAAVTFHQQWLQFACYLLSLGAMLQAARLWLAGRRRARFWALTLLALALAMIQLTVTEYFVGLELLRPLLLWLLVGQMRPARPPRLRAQLTQTLALSLPYLLLIAAYAAYRLFFIHLSGPDPYQAVTLSALLSNPLPTLAGLLRVMLQDSLYSLLTVWGPLLVTGRLEGLAPFQLAALAVGGLSAALTLVYLLRLREAPAQLPGPTGRAWQWQAALVGLAAFGLGILPAWATGREVVFDFHSDRYALPALLGASLLWVALIDWLTPARLQRAALVAVLVGLGASAQVRAGNDYRWLWQSETHFFWQLYWRAPYLQPGVALLTGQEVFPNQGLFSSSAALNLLYPPVRGRATLPYWWYTLQPRYRLEDADLPLQLTFHSQFRSLVFTGASPNTLLVQSDPSHGNCLWLLTPADQFEPGLSPLTAAFANAGASNLSLIQPTPPGDWRPPESMFGPEPDHTSWCYYFEKADLAAQLGDWTQAAALGDQARQQGYSPRDSRSNAPREWQPFVEAYARLGRWDEAADLTRQAAQKGAEFQPALCGLLGRIQAGTSEQDQTALIRLGQELDCNLTP